MNVFFYCMKSMKMLAEREKHKESEHYMQWRDTVSDWMEIPRASNFYKVIVPK